MMFIIIDLSIEAEVKVGSL